MSPLRRARLARTLTVTALATASVLLVVATHPADLAPLDTESVSSVHNDAGARPDRLQPDSSTP